MVLKNKLHHSILKWLLSVVENDTFFEEEIDSTAMYQFFEDHADSSIQNLVTNESVFVRSFNIVVRKLPNLISIRQDNARINNTSTRLFYYYFKDDKKKRYCLRKKQTAVIPTVIHGDPPTPEPTPEPTPDPTPNPKDVASVDVIGYQKGTSGADQHSPDSLLYLNHKTGAYNDIIQNTTTTTTTTNYSNDASSPADLLLSLSNTKSNTNTLDIQSSINVASKALLDLKYDASIQPLPPSPPSLNRITTLFVPPPLIQNCSIQSSYIISATNLDFNLSPRLHPISKCIIPIIDHNKRNLEEGMKWTMVTKAIELGYINLSKPKMKQLGAAVVKKISYLAGYSTVMGSSRSLYRWYQAYHSDVIDASIFKSLLGTNRPSYTKSIQEKFPTFLHTLFRYATKVLGNDAPTYKLFNLMNEKAKIDYGGKCNIRGNLVLTEWHFSEFFHRNGGKVKAPTSKPRLSPESIKLRYLFAKRNKLRLETVGGEFYYCFLDEKWFYIRSRRKKLRSYLLTQVKQLMMYTYLNQKRSQGDFQQR